MNKIKKGDTVFVLAGRDRRKTGEVLAVFPKSGTALVKDINRVKKTVKPNPHTNKPGGIIEKETEIQLSNIAIYNSGTQKPDKIKIVLQDNGKKVRQFKSNSELIDR